MSKRYTIGILARHTGIHLETIRYYQRRGLIEEPARPPRGIRHYTGVHARRLQFIRQAQSLGFTLNEVRELLALDDGRHCRQAELIGARKLALVRERLAQMRRVERALARLVRECHSNSGKVRCPLIKALEAG